ncbi:MAG TPA: hypothetical protein VFP84_20045 [Kofleriaceae bacterium]|nr:hypothetical protein [Kofleriaceae bacterium]
MLGSEAIERLRGRLAAAQVDPRLAVSEAAQQYNFDEDSAAFAEIDVKRGDDFVVVVVIGSLPFDQFVVDVWQRFAPEVWLVDASDEAITVARKGEPARVVGRGQAVRSRALPGVAIAIDELFTPPS